jgi:acyl carrier protein
VRQVVRQIIVNQLNVEPSFSDDASFVDDLGAD